MNISCTHILHENIFGGFLVYIAYKINKGQDIRMNLSSVQYHLVSIFIITLLHCCTHTLQLSGTCLSSSLYLGFWRAGTSFIHIFTLQIPNRLSDIYVIWLWLINLTYSMIDTCITASIWFYTYKWYIHMHIHMYVVHKHYIYSTHNKIN